MWSYTAGRRGSGGAWGARGACGAFSECAKSSFASISASAQVNCARSRPVHAGSAFDTVSQTSASSAVGSLDRAHTNETVAGATLGSVLALRVHTASKQAL